MIGEMLQNRLTTILLSSSIKLIVIRPFKGCFLNVCLFLVYAFNNTSHAQFHIQSLKNASADASPSRTVELAETLYENSLLRPNDTIIVAVQIPEGSTEFSSYLLEVQYVLDKGDGKRVSPTGVGMGQQIFVQDQTHIISDEEKPLIQRLSTLKNLRSLKDIDTSILFLNKSLEDTDKWIQKYSKELEDLNITITQKNRLQADLKQLSIRRTDTLTLLEEAIKLKEAQIIKYKVESKSKALKLTSIPVPGKIHTTNISAHHDLISNHHLNQYLENSDHRVAVKIYGKGPDEKLTLLQINVIEPHAISYVPQAGALRIFSRIQDQETTKVSDSVVKKYEMTPYFSDGSSSGIKTYIVKTDTN